MFAELISNLIKKFKRKPSVFNHQKEIMVDLGKTFSEEKNQRQGAVQKEGLPGSEEMLEEKSTGKITPTEKPAEIESEERESSNVLKTNLIQGEVVSFFDWRNALTMTLLFVGLGILVVGLIYASLFVWERYKKEQSEIITESFIEMQRQIVQMQEDIEDISGLQKKLELANTLINQHVYWTNLFKFLEDYTLSEVSYADFRGDLSGRYSLPAKANNFYIIAEQVKAFRKNEYIKEVSVSGGEKSTDSDKEAAKESAISFDLEIQVNTDLLRDYKGR